MYSLIRPLRTGFRRICCVSTSVTVARGNVAFVGGDELRDAVVGPCGVVVRLVVGQDGAQMSLAKDQHAVQALAAHGAGQAFAGRAHARSLDSGAGCRYYF